MDAKTLEQDLTEAILDGWDITPTGSGFLLTTTWQWPNHTPIEIYVRSVGERQDLYVVSDGGELFNCFYLEGTDLTADSHTQRTVQAMAKARGCEFIEYQLAKGANDSNLGMSIRDILETAKEISFYLWHKLDTGSSRH